MTQGFYQPYIPQEAVELGRVILKDGTTAELRPLIAADRPLLLEFLKRLSVESIGRRFFSATSPEKAADLLLGPGTTQEGYSLVVLQGGPDHPRIVAIGGYVRDQEDPEAAEVAFLVDDALRGKGLGTLLLERLALIAAQAGFRRFFAVTQADNRAMMGVFRESGFAVEESYDSGYISVKFSVEPSQESVTRAELRDKVATVASLRPFFYPRGVAVVGASRDQESVGYRVLEHLVMTRFQGPVYPINKNADVVGSLPAYSSLVEINRPIDLAVIAVPRDAVLSVVDDCAAKGVRALVVLTAGFAEVGPEGRELQHQLREKVIGYGMRLIGPNCLGVINLDPTVRLNASFSPFLPKFGRVAMSSQSGALGPAILKYAQDIDLGFSAFVSIGNKADVSSNDLMLFWEDDPNTEVILLYLESFGNPRRFARIARRVGRKKPVIAVKSGRTQAGSRAAGSHTAALAASDTVVEALFKQAGVIRVETLEEMFQVADLLANQPLPAGPRVAIVTNSGGPGILATDALAAAGLEVPETSAETQARLREFLPEAAAVANPIDMVAGASSEHYRQALDIVIDDPNYDSVLVIYTPLGLADNAGVAEAVGAAARRSQTSAQPKPILACFMEGGNYADHLQIGERRVPSYRFPEDAARALAQAYRYSNWRNQPIGLFPKFSELDTDQIRSLIKKAGPGWLLPNEVSQILQAAGLPPLPGQMAANADEAVQIASEIGYPVAVKLASRTIIHKTDWEGVRLNLADPTAVREACSAIRERLAQAGKEAELAGFWVQPMVRTQTELMVGVTHDRLFGPILAFGLGGIFIEVLRDVVFRIPPLSEEEALEMIRSIRGYPLLEGYRGHPPADIPALQNLLLRISQLVEEVPELAELDINPLVALAPGQGCRVLDARIRVE